MNGNLDYHAPEHPLPEEIQKMTRDDTVCKFCGVSYLIHSEIKKLEDKLKATLKELEFYKGSLEREEKLKVEVQDLKQSQDVLKEDLLQKNTMIEKMEVVYITQEKHIEHLNSKIGTLEKTVDETVSDREGFRLKLNSFHECLPGFMSQLQQQKSSMQNIDAFVRQQKKDFQNFSDKLQETVNNVCQRELTDTDKMRQDIIQLEKESLEYKTQNAKLQDEIESLKTDNVAISSLNLQLQQLRKECRNKEQDKQELRTEIEDCTSKLRMACIEQEQFKSQLKTKSQELESVTMQLRAKSQSNEQNIQRLQRELHQKTTDFEESTENNRTLQTQLHEWQRERESIERQASCSINQKEEMKKLLEKVQDELISFKIERELMIATHQNQIEQLRESFKTKMLEAGKWPDKLKEELSKEKKQHGAALKALEDKLKENFVMELQIEKQKHQELLDKSLAEFKDSDKMIKSQLSVINSKHKMEMVELEQHLQEAKTLAGGREESMKEEIQSLKNIIKDLEWRLGKLDTGSDILVIQLKSEIKEKDMELENKTENNNTLENNIATLKEENDLLQDTVRRECEERFALTESLSEAREELLQLKKPAKGYSSNSRVKTESPISAWSGGSDDNLKSTSSASLNSATRGSTSNLIPHPPSHPVPPSKEYANTSTVSVGFDGDKAGRKGGSVTESRKRIAQAMGRR